MLFIFPIWSTTLINKAVWCYPHFTGSMLHSASRYRVEPCVQACLMQYFGLLMPFFYCLFLCPIAKTASWPLWINKENSQILQSMKNSLTGPRKKKRTHQLGSMKDIAKSGYENSRGPGCLWHRGIQDVVGTRWIHHSVHPQLCQLILEGMEGWGVEKHSK